VKEEIPADCLFQYFYIPTVGHINFVDLLLVNLNIVMTWRLVFVIFKYVMFSFSLFAYWERLCCFILQKWQVFNT